MVFSNTERQRVAASCCRNHTTQGHKVHFLLSPSVSLQPDTCSSHFGHHCHLMPKSSQHSHAAGQCAARHGSARLGRHRSRSANERPSPNTWHQERQFVWFFLSTVCVIKLITAPPPADMNVEHEMRVTSTIPSPLPRPLSRPRVMTSDRRQSTFEDKNTYHMPR